MKHYNDIWYQSRDGLKLYAREYPNEQAEKTVLCMHGLTRNSADFAEVCDMLHTDYHLVAVDQRGRGLSEYDRQIANYQTTLYVQDMFTLIDHLQLNNVVLMGTSMGGLMAMMMNAIKPNRFAGIIINDIGPEIDPAGLGRIKGYVGKTKAVNSWDDAVEQTKALNVIAFPDYQQQDWEKFARRLYAENEQGVPELLYDPAISQPIDEDESAAVPPDLWPLVDALKPVPTLLIRGELSDILPVTCVDNMKAIKPDLQYVEVPGVGHAPMLTEPAAFNAIKAFLKR